MSDLTSSIADLLVPEQPIQDHRARPTNAFIQFEKHEIEQSIPDRFEQQVAKYPGRIAVKTGGCCLTYDALNRTANQVAQAIMAGSDHSEGPAALLLEQGTSLIAAILGVLKAGKFYLPLDPAYPPGRISYMLEHSQAGLMVTNHKNLSLANKLARNLCKVINVDEVNSSFSTENIGLTLAPDTLAYILYTSGSTGQPKGIVQNHRNVLHNIMNYTNALHICADDHISLLSSCSVSAAVSDIYGAVLNGAALFPYNIEEAGLAKIADWVIGEEITLYHSVPTLFRHFVGMLTGRESFPKLRLIRMGGESVYKRDVELYKRGFSTSCIFVNGLGSTETGAICRYFIDKETQIPSENVPVGYPVEDTEVLLLDDDGKDVGFGEVGEIVVKSRYIAPGYWRDPELTRAAYQSNSQDGSERLYRTGDLARRLPDGCFILLGRKDYQVKVRGHRIELAEVETALLNTGVISEAVVVAREDVAGEKRLVAYVVPRQKQGPTVREVRSFLTVRLPDYMVPAVFIFLDALPLTPNGKLDRRALPVPEWKRIELDGPFVAPRTPTEESVAKIWAQILGLPRVGVYDNFFEMGGQSLLGTQIISRVRDTFRAELPWRSLFDVPTVAGLAELIETIRWTDRGAQESPSEMGSDHEEGEL